MSHHIPLYRLTTVQLPGGGNDLTMADAIYGKRILDNLGTPATIKFSKSITVEQYRRR